MAQSVAIVRYAVVAGDEGSVVNVIEAAEGFVVEGATLVPDDGTARIGRVWDGAAFLPPANEPVPVPRVITRRQLLIALAAAGFISAEEALAAAQTGPSRRRSLRSLTCCLLRRRSRRGLPGRR